MELENIISFKDELSYLKFESALTQIDPKYNSLYENFLRIKNDK